jgi:hypothetical protein
MAWQAQPVGLKPILRRLLLLLLLPCTHSCPPAEQQHSSRKASREQRRVMNLPGSSWKCRSSCCCACFTACASIRCQHNMLRMP